VSDGIFYRYEEKLRKFHRRGRLASVGHGMKGPMLYTHYTLRLHRRKVLMGQVAYQLHTIKAETLSMMEMVKPEDFFGMFASLWRVNAAGGASR
jgi:hypothetical protein